MQRVPQVPADGDTGRVLTRRLDVIRDRASRVLDYLKAHGPAYLTEVCEACDIPLQRARYALRTLCEDRLAHVPHFDRIVGPDRIPRFLAVYVAGEGDSVNMPRIDEDGLPRVLDFKGTLHLQDVYRHWNKGST